MADNMNVRNKGNRTEYYEEEKVAMPDNGALRNQILPQCVFNRAGLIPVAGIFICPIDELINFTKGLCADFFGPNGINSIDLDADLRAETVNMYVWFRWDSKHIVDNSLANDPNAVINKAVPRWSKELKQFMEAFCREENRKVVNEGDGRGDRTFKCIKVDVYKIFCAMFDRNGKSYNEVYYGGKGKDVQCPVYVNTQWDENTGRVKFFSIKKEEGRNCHRKPIIPKAAFRARS